MKRPALLPIAMFLALVPVTLPVPGLHELVTLRHGGTETDAHIFMIVNMLSGIIGVPMMMRVLRRAPDVRRWLTALFIVDAAAFLGMSMAGSLGALFAFRTLDGFVHLPAVTLLMVASNRGAAARDGGLVRGRGGSLGVLASALMLGVTVGSPLGGWLVQRGPEWVYLSGAALLIAGAVLAQALPRLPDAPPAARRYQWDRRSPETWVPLGYAFLDRFSIGIFVSTFTLFLAREHGIGPGARGLLVALFMIPFAALCYPAGHIAERRGWFVPMLAGNIGFGLVYASYGVVPKEMLPLVMVLSGIASAFMFAPSLLLVSDLARRGHGDGLFGAFQVAGSLGFLCGPIAGGVLVALTARGTGRASYEAIFAGVGAVELVLAVVSWVVLRRLASDIRHTEPIAVNAQTG